MSSSKPVIVLVPGAFHRPSSWNAVADGLRKQGHTVLTPPLAVCGESTEVTGLAGTTALDDVKLIHSVLLPALDNGDEAVIVSHSYGSVPATLAVEGQTIEERAAKGLKGGIKALVSIAGFSYPVRGKSIMGDDSEPPLMPYHVLKDGILYLQEPAKALFYSDLDDAGQETAWKALYKAQSRSSLCHFPHFITSDIKIPKLYVFCEEDKTLEPSYQEAFIQIGGFDQVVKLPAGHSPLLSMPEKVVDIIVSVA
ncbi:alpha/beta-hydrolase [Thozetella sp. PMI_491]|nr:alpha/beta-hydrolase [Thozetella sp. PMI_491]